MRSHLFRFLISLTLIASPVAARADLASDRAAFQQEYETLLDAPQTRAVDFPDGRSLRPGDLSRDVPLLRVALANYGFKPATIPDENPFLFDAGLATALKTFQGELGLKDDGILGPGTRRALRGMDGNRLLRLKQTLAQPDFPQTGRYIYANVAAGMVYAMRDGKVEIASKAVIGKPGKDTATPSFSATIYSITMNPTWTATKAIRDREFGGNPHVEKPGPNNPLGKIRIDMQDPYQVYMHSTNHPQLFARDNRTFSHGCVRIEKIIEFARWLTGNDQWADEDLDSSLGNYVTRRVTLDEPVPVYIQYRTAGVASTGSVIYYNDPYKEAAPPEEVRPEPDAIPPAAPVVSETGNGSAIQPPSGAAASPLIPASVSQDGLRSREPAPKG